MPQTAGLGHVDLPTVLAAPQQVRAMREEEVSDASWFALPEDGDEDVDWTSFTVDIEGPVRQGGVGHGLEATQRAQTG